MKKEKGVQNKEMSLFWETLTALAVLLAAYFVLHTQPFFLEVAPRSNGPFALGQYYFNQDENPDGPYDLEKARKYFDLAIKEDAADGSFDNNLLWYQFGRIDFLEGKFDAAIYKFNKQIEYFEDDPPNVHYMIGLTYGFKAKETHSPDDWEKAEKGFKRFIEFSPDTPWAKVDLSWVYFAQGKFEEIAILLEPHIEIYTDNAWIHNMYGLALLNTNKKLEAQKHFETALVLSEKLTTEDWGKSYPGNNPASWASGLAQMRTAIRDNLELSKK